MFFFDPLYFLFALPALLLGMYAQYKVRSAYAKYTRVRNRNNMAGQEAARRLLSVAGLSNVIVEATQGELTDHYDPRSKRLRLSSGVYGTPSVAALGIVAHEVGHAVQDHQGYAPLRLRGAIVPAVQVGSWLGPLMFIGGMLLQVPNLQLIGLVLFGSTLVFALVTLPVELNASRRAVALLQQAGLTTSDEEKGVRSVLSAASLTYVAAAVQALMTLLYYLTLFSGSRRRS